MLRRLAMVGGSSSISPAASRARASVGPDPDGGDGLPVVVAGDLAGWGRGDEEPGVVPARGQLGSDPVADVVDGVGGQYQPLLVADVEQPGALLVDRVPVDGEAGSHRRVGRVEQVRPGLDPVAGRPGHQDAGLLEALPQRRHPEGQATGVDAQGGAGLGVGQPLAQGLRPGPPVLGIHRAAREDVGTGHELGGQVAAEHADLDGRGTVPILGVTDQHHRGGIAEGHAHRGQATVRPTVRPRFRCWRRPPSSVRGGRPPIGWSGPRSRPGR